MTDLIVVPQAAHWQRLKRLVLDSVSSPITRRVYNLGLNEFFEWYGREPRPGFTKATVAAWRVALEARRLGAVFINVRITAVRKLAVELPTTASSHLSWRAASRGLRCGIQGHPPWELAFPPQAQKLLNTPDIKTNKGCAIARFWQSCWDADCGGQRWRHLRLATSNSATGVGASWIPRQTWTGPNDPDAAVGESGDRRVDHRSRGLDGSVFRPVNRAGRSQSVGLSEKVVWQLLQGYAAKAGVAGIAPHDLRRTCAKMCRASCGELEQIQLLLGYAAAQTTERYLGTKQDLVHAPNDGIKLRVAV